MNHHILYNRAFALIVAMIVVTSLAISGSSRKKAEPRRLVTGEEVIVSPNPEGAGYPATYSTGPGDSIGYTTYDYGTNGSASRNLIDYGSSVALIRMAAHDISGSTLDRGSWRKCSVTDGSSWPGAMTKVEVLRRGWSNIFDLGGVEGVVSHVALEVNVDTSLCGNGWTSTLTGNAIDTWPRVAVTNGDDIHIIAANNPPTTLFYTRSLDGGATFDMVHVTIATEGSGVEIDADAYDIASDGTNLAVVIAGIGTLGAGDVILLESADNGATWTQSTIHDVDQTGCTAQDVPDGSTSAIYDNDGDLHVAWGSYFNDGTCEPDTLFYSTASGIYHWSAASGVQLIGLPPDSLIVFNEIWRDGAVATQPDLAVDADNNIYCVYSSWINEVDVYGNSYEHVIGVGSLDNGVTWSNPSDLTPGTGFDASFPSIADDADDNTVNLVYSCDPYAGNWLQASVGGGLHPHIQVATMYLNVPTYDFFPLCDDISSFLARCAPSGGGLVQARVSLSGSTIHAGRTVLFDVDETIYPAVIGTNGTSSRASISVVLPLGTHTITLIDPADCYAPAVRTCVTGTEKADAEWEAEDALWGESTEDVQEVAAAQTKLLGNHPNPFNPSTTIRYVLSADAKVSVKVYNMLGQEVATLFNGTQKAGEQSVVWNGTNNAGYTVASGLYIYKIQAGNVVMSEKMLFAK